MLARENYSIRMNSNHFTPWTSKLGRRSQRILDTRSVSSIKQVINIEPRTPPIPKLPPGLRGRVLGHAGFMSTDQTIKQDPFYRLMLRRKDWYKECGSNTVLINLAGTKLCVCCDPHVYREVFVEKRAHFTNSNSFRDAFGSLFPKSMMVLEGEDWQRVRRVSQRALNRMDMNTVINAVIDVTETGINNNALGRNTEDVDTFRFLSYLTFDVFHKVMYGMDPQTVTGNPNNPHVHLLQNCESLLTLMLSRGTFKLLWRLPTKLNRELEKNRKEILQMGSRLATQRRLALSSKEPKDPRELSLLDCLLLSQDEDIMSNDEVIDQIVTFFFGAYEPTTNSLLFALHSLADNPVVQRKLRSELRRRFPNGKADIVTVKLADLDEIKYLLWTIEESFRLNSTTEGIFRDVIKDVIVGGYQLKAGTGIFVDHRTVSRDPQFFGGQTDLDEFIPDRFNGFHMEKLLSLPFGFGPRVCPGRRIALAQMKAILAVLICEFEILPPVDHSKKLIMNSKLGLTCVDGTGWLRFRRLEQT